MQQSNQAPVEAVVSVLALIPAQLGLKAWSAGAGTMSV